MSRDFFETSKTIANEFLQSVVFIDDRAFIEEKKTNEHGFSAVQITRAFAKSRKICAVYRPENLQDIGNLALLAKKADVTVLDWRIEIKEDEIPEENGEEDAEEIDPRGPHTLKIIREILSDPLTGKGSLKLILIYTGETDLPGITDAIHHNLKEQEIDDIQKGDCTIFTENIRILVLAKKASEIQFRHNPKLRGKIVSYEDLPEFILTQFTKMTSGLLTNFVLQSLAVIRGNTFRLVKLYKKELDISFLAHRQLLTNPEDTKDHLIEILSQSIQALLNYNNSGDSVSKTNILNWIDSYLFDQTISINGSQSIEINNEFVKVWVKSSFIEACRKQWVEKGFSNIKNTPDNQFKTLEKKFQKKASEFFTKSGAYDIDAEFSILTHHKSNLKQPSIVPKLTLGTLVKQLPKAGKVYRENEIERYFLCIQAKCDSVRIDALRKFLFIPLEKIVDEKPFQLVVYEGDDLIRLRIERSAFDLRTIKFQPKTGKDFISAYKRVNNYYFKSNHNERFLWLADLKDSHAQREVHKFASQISRVGLDESEWLRRWSGN
ncbi:response regulator receiver domain [Lunatibacter salilacus]|uniref:response regulator receiver domain n=1 Tax=Lunatibacter salilacus TaxID=2483804 RepID=UPI00131E9AA4|nr:response regulator receiver domain [Lunatibacter salilacus]